MQRNRSISLFWSLALGFGLTLALLGILTFRSAAGVETVSLAQPRLDPPPNSLAWPDRPNSPAGSGQWDSEEIYAPAVLSDGGQFEMWYTGYGNAGSSGVGLATSPNGIDWAKASQNPLLTGNEVMVLKEADYKMWFSSEDSHIYRATSSDGLTWTVNPTVPVFSPTFQNGTFDRDYAGDPFIVQDISGTYWMFYEAANWDWDLVQIGVATSTNGIDWTRVQTTPVLTPGSPGDWDEKWVLDPMVLLDGGGFKLWYSALDNGWTRRIGYVTSTNGLDWTKHPNNPVFEGVPGEWDEGRAAHPFIYYDGNYHMWYDSNRAIGYVTSTNGITWTRFLTGPVLEPGASLFIDVNYAHEWVEGRTTPNATVLITVADAGGVRATTDGQADPSGWFASWQWGWDPQSPDIQPGDTVTVSAAGLVESVDPVGAIDMAVDMEADTVSGTLQAPWFAPLSLTVSCEIWEEFAPAIEITDVLADGGSYFCDFNTQGWDLQPNQTIAVRYYEPDDDTVINVYQFPWARVCYGQDWVGADYPSGHTFWITVTDSGGGVKATAEISTTSGGGWNGDGFQTDWWHWTPDQPDIAVGDWTHFQSDDGYSNTVQVGTVSGTLDIDADSISGPVYATWFTQTLDVQCHPWGGPAGAPGKSSTAAPDGSAPYSCQWNPLTEWDIQPGQDVAVMYIEPDDGDRVINVFYQPAPDLSIDKNTSGQPAPGGNLVYQINYQNREDAAATDVRITDTLPAGTTYLTDTAPFAHTVLGNQVVWDVGQLPAYTFLSFDLFVTVSDTLSPGDGLTNVVQIHTPDVETGDPNDNAYTHTVQVITNDTHLNLEKWAWTSDPVPGYDFVYAVKPCNTGSTDSSQVTLTDTLHPSTTLQYWWSQYPGWVELFSSSDRLVLSHPSIPAWTCSEVYVRVYLDENAWSGMSITNTVYVTASNDLESDDNDDFWQSQVGDPHVNLSVNKNWYWGRLYPGGRLGYEFNYRNDGNLPVDDVLLTDTLPVSTTFGRAWRSTPYGEQPLTPTLITDEYVVWDLGTLDNGYFDFVSVRLDIDDTPPLGTLMINTVEISPQPLEDRYDDNLVTWSYPLNDAGPNLQVNKQNYNWNWEGQLSYELQVKNMGSQRLEDIWITDTYPVSTTWNGDWQIYHGLWTNLIHDAPNRQLIFQIQALDPGETASSRFSVDLDGAIVGVQGLAFTNTVQSPLSGDVYPADNTDQVVAYTGPDVYVEKWLSGGQAKPGETVTFTIQFGNQNREPWSGDGSYSSHVTDTLPAGMSFITATAPWDPSQPWQPQTLSDGLVAWEWGTMGANSSWQFDLVAQISDTVQIGDVLTNVVAAYGDSPNDVEPDWHNNLFELPVTILGPVFQVDKTYQSSRVAGTAVTYTLTVSNTGAEAGTNVTFSDTLPAGLTYGGSDGAFDGTTITWTVASIAPYTGTASGWFSASLACSGTITNDTYRVVSSDQRASSGPGPAVSLDIVSPTISTNLTHTLGPILVDATVQFTATAETDGPPLSYAWDLGDGTRASSGLTTSHTYTQTGDYTVVFSATDACGYQGVSTASLTVDAPPCDAVSISDLSSDSPVELGQGLHVTATVSGTEPISYTWDFGGTGVGVGLDGPTPVFSYTAAGNYTVTLSVTNACPSQDAASIPVSVTSTEVTYTAYLPVVIRND